MGASETTGDGDREGGDAIDDESTTDLVARVERLQAENRRLKREYAAARRSRYRRTAFGLYAVGAVAVLGALAFPDAREVLFALGATGLFAGVLTYYLAPERFLSERVGEGVAAANAATLAALAADLGLAEPRVYLPADGGAETDVLLFLPQTARYDAPDDPDPGVHAPDDGGTRGLVVVPAGGPLLRDLERGLDGGLAADPERLADQAAEAVEAFELATSARAETAPVGEADASDRRLTLRCTEPALGPPTREDHPVASLTAALVARARETPVELRVDQSPADPDEYLITAAWSG